MNGNRKPSAADVICALDSLPRTLDEVIAIINRASPGDGAIDAEMVKAHLDKACDGGVVCRIDGTIPSWYLW